MWSRARSMVRAGRRACARRRSAWSVSACSHGGYAAADDRETPPTKKRAAAARGGRPLMALLRGGSGRRAVVVGADGVAGEGSLDVAGGQAGLRRRAAEFHLHTGRLRPVVGERV